MHNTSRRRLIAIPLAALIILPLASSAPAYGQGFAADKSQQATGSTAKKKKKKKAKARRRPNSQQEPSSGQSAFFPDWPVASFDYDFDPITGFQTQSSSAGGINTLSTYSEIGLGAGLSNIPIPGGNPGVTLSPQAATTFGNITSATEQNGTTNNQSANFQRSTGGLDIHIYYQWFRYRLGVTSGLIDYQNNDDAQFADARTIRLINEPAVLILPSWLALLTVDYSQLWSDDYGHPELKETDTFLHTRKSFELLKLWVDAGPGVSVMQRRDPLNPADPSRSFSYTSGQSTYAMATAGAHLFWKIGASMRMKYIIAASSDIDDRFASVLIPDKKVSNPTAVNALPEDTFEQSFSIGASNIFMGLGVVWQYQRTVYGFTAAGDGTREVSNQGYSVTFSLGL